jgi:hypothetical protein
MGLTMANAELTRIKGNISKMLSQNAPEADIDAYLSGEGYDASDVRDPVRFEVKSELNAQRKSGAVPAGDGKGRQWLQGMTIGAADEALAGLTTPFEMIKRGTLNPAKGYEYAKAREDILLEEARKKGGILGTAAEVAGGIATGGAFAKAGLTAMPANPAAASFGRNLGGVVADSAAFGAATGFNEGSGLADRLSGAATGGAVGGIAGGAVGAAAPVVSAVGRNAMGFVNAVRDPDAFANQQVARALMESGRPVKDIAQEVTDASVIGQPFTVADALGNPGQRMLSVVARNPGQGRTAVVNALNSRQADQSGRVSGYIDEALGAGPTARQTSKALMEQAAKDAEPLYTKALSAKPVWDERVQQFLDDPIMKEGLRRGVRIQRLEALAKGEKFDPTDLALKGFDDAGEPILDKVPNMRTLNVIKKGVDDILEGYRDKVTGRLNLDEEGRAIEAVRKAYVETIDGINPDYAAARKAWAGPASVDEAVGRGQYAASRGRAADNLDIFNGLGEPQKQGYRAGYADKLSEKTELAAPGQNVVRRLQADKYERELPALSRFQGPLRPNEKDTLGKALQREQTMFETRNQALGGSRTADNLADNDAAAVNPEIIGNILGGQYLTAGRNIVARSKDTLSGNTPKVREKIAQALLNRDGKGLEEALQMTFKNEQERRRVIAQLLRSGIGGVSAGSGNVNQRTK